MDEPASRPAPEIDPNPNEALWRGLLEGTDPVYARTRARMKHIPGSPRCKMCAAPFGTPGSFLMRLQGRHRWEKNPDYCNLCFDVLSRFHGGAEIASTFLFADVRGSTTIAEGMRPADFRRLLDRFYDVATRVIIRNDGIVDKFVGDEAMGIFIPATAHEHHAAKAVAAARELLEATSERIVELPVGVGVATGIAFVGSVGEPPVTSLTALGDIVNVAARLASAAAAGEILMTEPTVTTAHLAADGLDRRELALKGKTDVTVVYAMTVR
ncbi:MAG TPA: adenylate/guanylate cyclase domain-containing protein [Candidatus Acidoferrum sp.]|nr:adenylate/guanylate cyclase domain-containing protein [Candidatus Acidoferrum sp.]